jgi:uncharacterized cupin superfamily protein
MSVLAFFLGNFSVASRPTAITAENVEPRLRKTTYPEPFASRMGGRVKKALGDVFGLSNFGVNLTRLAPGGISSFRHAHTKQDEFVYILEGRAVLITDEGETLLKAGMCAGFKSGTGNAHRLVNRGLKDCVYLEIGDRTAGDEAIYPDDDLHLVSTADGKRVFQHKDGRPY